MGLLAEIKNDVKKSGGSKKAFFYIREGSKVRLRFLEDMEDGRKFKFHDSFQEKVNCPCQSEVYGKSCPYCDNDDYRTRYQYAWSVYNYETNKVELFMFPVNNCSPIPQLAAYFETYGTLTDRDYVFSVSGKGKDKSYTIVPMDKAKFRNPKAVPYSEKKILELLAKAFPFEGDTDEDEPEEKPKKKRQQVEDAEDETPWDDTEGGTDYASMKPVELYKMCVKRGIEAEPRKPQRYYVRLLQEADKAEEDWGDSEQTEDAEDEWEE